MHVDELRAGSGWLRKVLRPAVRIRFEGAYDSENDEFVSKLGSLYSARAMARQMANVARKRQGSD
jgi:hypothetical protein